MMAAISSAPTAANSLWVRWVTAPQDATPAERRSFTLLTIAGPAALLIHFFYTFLFAYWVVWPLAIVNVFSVLPYIAVIILWRQGRLSFASALGTIEPIIHNTLVVVFLGWGFGMQYYFFLLAVVIVLASWGPRWLNVSLVALLSLLFITLYYYTELYPPLASPPAVQMAIINATNIAASFGTIAALTVYLVSEVEHADKLNEDLLNNVLPRPIATRLKHEPATIADGFQNASILFADIAGFTPVSQDLTPDELVQMLDAIFSRFDELVDQYGLEKIKTIGDEYMVASGIPIPRDDHAQALANFALAMRDSLAEYSAAKDVDLQMRIGLNSGPVVAGVIGKRRFLYDLWGDSVNTASRMESHGIPGEIQVTEATRDLLDGRFTFIDRGVIDIKGKGPMQTYLLQPNGRA